MPVNSLMTAAFGPLGFCEDVEVSQCWLALNEHVKHTLPGGCVCCFCEMEANREGSAPAKRDWNG